MSSEKLIDVGSERAILAGLLQHGIDGYVAISDIVNEESFGNINNKVIFRCIEHVVLNDQTVDIPSILSAAEQLNLSETVNTKQELTYINSLAEFPVHRDNIFKFGLMFLISKNSATNSEKDKPQKL